LLAHHGFSQFGGCVPLPAAEAHPSPAVFILWPGLAFLDGEQDDVVVADEPERPRRRVGGPQRRRQQYLVRRLIGVGVGLAFLILVVLAFRGCLEARSDRALRNYDSNVATIMQQSEQSGKDFFELLSSPSGSSSSVDVQNQVFAQRDASSTLLDRADSLDTPGQMSDAQAAVEQTLTLRRNALTAIAANVTQAAASRETANAITTIGNAMGALYASDVIWTQLAKPDMTKVLKDEGVEGQPLPPGNFMPANATDYLDQASLVTKLSAITGGSTATSGGVHGLTLDSTMIGDTQLSPDTTTTVASDSQEIDIGVTNAGDSDETGISVTVQIGGSSLTGQLQSLTAGQSDTIKIPLTTKPTPGTTTPVEVVVNPVPGETVTDNNSSTYQVIFGS
jgi:CARDB